MKGNASTHTTNAAYREGWERAFGGGQAISDERDLNTVTAAEWRAASPAQRRAFTDRERRRGYVSMVCLNCGFPSAYGQSRCEACW